MNAKKTACDKTMQAVLILAIVATVIWRGVTWLGLK